MCPLRPKKAGPLYTKYSPYIANSISPELARCLACVAKQARYARLCLSPKKLTMYRATDSGIHFDSNLEIRIASARVKSIALSVYGTGGGVGALLDVAKKGPQNWWTEPRFRI
jgi:hypothetical protein